MELIANAFVRRFLQRDIIDEAMQDMYKEGLILIIADMINISVILLMGFCMGKPLYSLLFLIVFWTVRWFSGGYHAKTYWFCRITTIASFIFTVVIGELLKSKMQYLSVLFTAVTIVTILIFAPIEHPNKELSAQVRCASKRIALLIALAFSVCSYLLCIYAKMEGFIISTTLFTIAILMYTGMLFNGRGGERNE